MQPDVQTLLEQAAPVPRRGPDVPAIVTGGRRLRALRRLGRSAIALTVVAAAALFVPAAFEDDRAAERGVQPVQPAAPEEDPQPFLESRPSRMPAYVDRVRGERAYLVGDKEVVVHGIVGDQPWSMVELVTDEDGERSHCAEIFLGRDGRFGGGNACAAPAHAGADPVTLWGFYWGDVPDVVIVAGSVREPAVTARVEMEDGRTRPLEILPSAKDDAVGWYAFFPPPFERGRVVALDADGRQVGSRPICFPIEDGGFSMEPLEEGENVGGCSQ